MWLFLFLVAAMKEIIPSPQTHPLAGISARVEIQNVQRSQDGVEIKFTIENGGRKSVTLADPVFSAFLSDGKGNTLNNAAIDPRLVCYPPAERYVPQDITIAPGKTWQSSLWIKQVLRPKAAPSEVPSGTYEVYTLLLIASASNDPGTAPKRMFQAQIAGIEVTKN